VVHYLARHGESRVAKAVIISAVPPLMVKAAANPGAGCLKLKNSTLKTYKGFPHGMPTTEADTINADLLVFLKKTNQVAA
jgi:pimeloyl-ACP methyl ester carboxylesterase